VLSNMTVPALFRENLLPDRSSSVTIGSEPMDKRRIAASFSAAAKTYDNFAGLQKDTGSKLLLSQAEVGKNTLIADVGCGTGWLTGKLRLCFPQACLIGMDLAEGMIEYAVEHRSALADGWWVADMEALPVADASCDLLFSNLAMQWLEQPIRWFREAARVLRPGGQLLCSTLLPGTLYELASCWRYADQHNSADAVNAHVNHFISEEELLKAVNASGLTGRLVSYQDVRYYASVRDIMAELKGIGAHNISNNRPQTITSKGRIRLMLARYEHFLTDNGYPATYQVALISLRKLAERN
jgi:malonyl-CoA O-methyltransferase